MPNPRLADARRHFLCGGLATGAAALLSNPVRAQQQTQARTTMDAKRSEDAIRSAVRDVAVANRILANEGVVDAYGHISLRHPTDPGRFLLSRNRSPALVEPGDIMEFRLDGTPVDQQGRNIYIERLIHGSIYKARPDINAVAHSHAPEVLPYTVTRTPLKPVIHSAGMIGANIPLWDIRTKNGDTNLLVVNATQGDDLAAALGRNNVVLMRGHGFAAAGRNLIEVLRMSIYLRLNATVLSEASRIGEPIPLSEGEIARIAEIAPDAPELRRAWEYWARRAGVADLLAAP